MALNNKEKTALTAGAGVGGLTLLVAKHFYNGINGLKETVSEHSKFVADAIAADSNPVNYLPIIVGGIAGGAGLIRRPKIALKTFGAYLTVQAVRLSGLTGNMDFRVPEFMEDAATVGAVGAICYGLGYVVSGATHKYTHTPSPVRPLPIPPIGGIHRGP